MPTVRPRTTIYLWEFLLQLLDGKENCAAISWVNRERGEFVLKDQSEIAKLWGKVKGRPRMDKIKLGRAMRYYYKKKLLAKVPRRKAVYRFTKFDHLKQKQAEIIRHDDFPEIDFNENAIVDFVNDDKSEGESSLPAEVDGDEEDTPLENLLAERSQQLHHHDEKYQNVFSVEDPYGSMDNINESSCSFYDHNSNVTNFSNQNDDYYVPCSEMNPVSSYERQNYSNYVKSASVAPMNYNAPEYHYPSLDCNNSYPPCDVENGGHLASLLLNSILMSDQQTSQDAANLRESYQTVPVSCTPTSGNITPEVMHSHFHMKSEPFVNNLAASSQFQDFDVDANFNTLKEFERLLMINRSF